MAVVLVAVCALGIAIVGALFGVYLLDEKRARLVIEKLHEQEMTRLRSVQTHPRLADDTTRCHDARCAAFGKHRCHNLDCKAHRASAALAVSPASSATPTVDGGTS